MEMKFKVMQLIIWFLFVHTVISASVGETMGGPTFEASAETRFKRYGGLDPVCRDHDEECYQWARKGWCVFREVKQQCWKSCKICHDPNEHTYDIESPIGRNRGRPSYPGNECQRGTFMRRGLCNICFCYRGYWDCTQEFCG